MVDKDLGKQPPDKSCLQDAAAAVATVRHKEDAIGQEPGNQALKQLISAVRTLGSDLQSVLESEEESELDSELDPATDSEAELETTAGSKHSKPSKLDREKKELESFSDSSSNCMEKEICDNNLDNQQRCYEKGVLDTCESQKATSNKGIPDKGLEAIGKGNDNQAVTLIIIK